jgi:hypothetical protein
MDSDEFYKIDEFIRVKNFLIKNPEYDSSACNMETYYKESKYKISPPEDYYVPLIYKITEVTEYSLGCNFPVLVDPTRRIKTINGDANY